MREAVKQRESGRERWRDGETERLRASPWAGDSRSSVLVRRLVIILVGGGGMGLGFVSKLGQLSKRLTFF